MAKLIVFAAIMVALLAIAQASGSTTPISTVDEEGLDNQQIQEKCWRQIRQHEKQLNRCRQFLEYQRDELFRKPETQEHLRECCKGLRKLKGETCRCDFVKDAHYVAGKGRPWGERESQRRTEAARYLPKNCKVGPQKCF